MALQKTVMDAYVSILKEELLTAMGCTEPISIAYAAAILRKELAEQPWKVEAKLSGNIIKNVKSVIVPATGGLHGIEAAIAAGIIAGCPEKQLAVLTDLPENAKNEMRTFLQTCAFSLEEMESEHTFDLLLTAYADEKVASVHIQCSHVNVVSVLIDGADVTEKYLVRCETGDQVHTDRSVLNVEDIITFADTVELDVLREDLYRQIGMNMAIAEEGLQGDYGACIGKVLYAGGKASLRDKARAFAAAGSDARMSGCEMPVCILSGSGNQGITASVPVIVYGREMGVTEDVLLRALIVADLITIHQKTGIGCLSAYCGAISAGCGAGAGICYLEGGKYNEIAHTVVNAVAILSGTICDGAKPSCAAKIAMAVEAGIMGFEMQKAGHQFYGGDGIVTKGVENTIRNVGILARDGMGETDKEIIRIMLGKSGC